MAEQGMSPFEVLAQQLCDLTYLCTVLQYPVLARRSPSTFQALFTSLETEAHIILLLILDLE